VLSVSLSRAAEISRILSHLLFLGSENVTSKKMFYYAFLRESMGFINTQCQIVEINRRPFFV